MSTMTLYRRSAKDNRAFFLDLADKQIKDLNEERATDCRIFAKDGTCAKVHQVCMQKYTTFVQLVYILLARFHKSGVFQGHQIGIFRTKCGEFGIFDSVWY